MKKLLLAAVLLCSLFMEGCEQPSLIERERDTFINVNIPRAKQQASELFR